MSLNCLLLSHVFIRQNESYKRRIIDTAIKYYRTHYDNLYIILTGHGLHPNSYTVNNVDHIYWPGKILEQEIHKGHPLIVNKGLDHAKEKGFTSILKMRADGILMLPKIFKFCSEKLQKYNRKVLITQMTCNYRYYIGDLFMYGDIDTLKSYWSIKHWYPTKSGMTSLGKNFLRTLGINPSDKFDPNKKYDKHLEGKTWSDLLKHNFAIVNISTIRWIDYRPNWEILFKKESEIMNGTLDYRNYLWGTKEKWILFDNQGKMSYCRGMDMFCESNFNANYTF